MEAGQLGQGLEKMNSQELVFKEELTFYGLKQNFSCNTLYIAYDKVFGEVVVKSYVDKKRYGIVANLYEYFSQILVELGHFCGVCEYKDNPSLIMRKLYSVELSRDNFFQIIDLIVKSISRFHKYIKSDLPFLEIDKLDVSAIVENVIADVEVNLKNDNEYRYVLVHGDLYMNNILYDSEGKINFIDLDRVCFSVIEKDYATLALSVLLNVDVKYLLSIINHFQKYAIDYVLFLLIMLSEVKELKTLLICDASKLDFIYQKLVELIERG